MQLILHFQKKFQSLPICWDAAIVYASAYPSYLFVTDRPMSLCIVNCEQYRQQKYGYTRSCSVHNCKSVAVTLCHLRHLCFPYKPSYDVRTTTAPRITALGAKCNSNSNSNYPLPRSLTLRDVDCLGSCTRTIS